MRVIDTPIADLKIIEPRIFEDDRGYFFETYNKKAFETECLNYEWVQDNESKSSYGVVRGLHYQLAPYSQAKLVRVLEGKVFDVAVDIRKNSPTFGQWYGVELSSENKLQFLIPRGFAHGFSVLSETAVFLYKCDDFYNKEAERGIIFNDPDLNIDWKINPETFLVSPKDKILPSFKNAEINFY